MLGNRSKTNPVATPAETTSLIAGGTQIRGDVTFNGRLHVDGSVEGALLGEGDNAVLTLSNSARNRRGSSPRRVVRVKAPTNSPCRAPRRPDPPLKSCAKARCQPPWTPRRVIRPPSISR